MSIRKGTRYEREVARQLRDRGWTVERVTGSGGFTGTSDCDLIMLPPDSTAADGVPLADDPRAIRAEVKYSAKASGFTTVYDVHARLYGLALPVPLSWAGEVMTTGLDGLTQCWGRESVPAHRIDESPGKIGRWLRGKDRRGQPDVVLCRGARRQWVTAWRCVEGEVVTTVRDRRSVDARVGGVVRLWGPSEGPF